MNSDTERHFTALPAHEFEKGPLVTNEHAFFPKTAENNSWTDQPSTFSPMTTEGQTFGEKR